MLKKSKRKKRLIKPIYVSKVDPVKLAFIVGLIVAIYTSLATLLSIFVINAAVLVHPFEIFYGTIGYSISPLGLLLGTAYSFTDAFILIWLISMFYNRFVIED